MRNVLVSSVALIGALVAAVPAAASVTVYTSEDAFKAALSSTTSYNFKYDKNVGQVTSYTGGSVTFSSDTLQAVNYYKPDPTLIDYANKLSISSTSSAVGLYLGTPYTDLSRLYYFFGDQAAPLLVKAKQTTFIGFIDSSGSINGRFEGVSSELDIYKFITGTGVIAGTDTGTGTGTGTGTVAGAVPEPATWAMMVAGFGMVGAGLRQRRRNTARGRVTA